MPQLLFSQEAESTVVVKGLSIGEGANVTFFGNLVNNDTSILYLDGHITMLGDSVNNYSSIEGLGLMEMVGLYDQHISGGGHISVDTLNVDNDQDVSFDNDITINKYFGFINGVLYDNYYEDINVLDLPSVTFVDGASYDSSLVRDESYVEGLVTKKGTGRFVFPIGDAGIYRPVLADNNMADSIVSAHYFLNELIIPDDLLNVHFEILNEEYWYVSGISNCNDLTFTYDGRTSNFDPEDDVDNIKIATYDHYHNNDLRILDVVQSNTLAEFSYQIDSTSRDSSFNWFSFARAFDVPVKDAIFVPQILVADGANSRFVIDGLDYYDSNSIIIFNRHGNVVFEMDEYDNTWDGKANVQVLGSDSNLLPTGTYFVLLYIDGELAYKDFIQLLYTN